MRRRSVAFRSRGSLRLVEVRMVPGWADPGRTNRRRALTTKAAFTEEERDLVLEGPTNAGLTVSAAERGGTFREALSMAKAYAEARKQHGDSELSTRSS